MQSPSATTRAATPDQRTAVAIRTARSRLAIGLFLCFLAFYAATASGHTITIDGEYYYRAAESLALRRSFAVEPTSPSDLGRFALRAPDGQIYGKFAPLQSVVEAPFYLVARPLLSWFLGTGLPLEQALRVWVPVASTATISAALIALTALAVLALGYSRRIALAVALVLGLATLIWPYGRSEFSEPLQALLLLGAFVALRRVRPTGAGHVALLSGLLLGLLVLAKAINLLVLPIFGLALLWRLRHAPRRAVVEQAMLFGIAALVGVGAFCLLNLARTGSPLDFGYDEPFDVPLLLGLYGWTLSPGKGVLLYMPVLVAAAVAFPSFARRHGYEAAVIAATSALLVFFYARFWAWSGDWAWGTRFALPLLPLWILPIATAMSEWRLVGRALLAISVAASLAVQTLGVLVDPMSYLAYYYARVSPLYGEPEGYSWAVEPLSRIHFALELSPILMHARILLATLAGPSSRAVPKLPLLVEPPPLARALGIERWLPTPSGPLLGLDPWPLRAPPGQEGWIALGCLCALLAVGALLIVWSQTDQPSTR
jgi:hypothetical protein